MCTAREASRLEQEPQEKKTGDELAGLRARVACLEAELSSPEPPCSAAAIRGIPLNWDLARGLVGTADMRMVMMWLETTLAGLLLGIQATVGPQRFALCLRAAGQQGTALLPLRPRGVEDFHQTFQRYSDLYVACGWGLCELDEFDLEGRRARIRVLNSWEGRLQRSLGTCWGSCILAGRLSALCSELFGCPCWAEQTAFLARGDAHDAFQVAPSGRTVEDELERLLPGPEATNADMAVALQRLRGEVEERTRLQATLRELREGLELQVEERTRELAETHERLRQEVRERFRAEELFRLMAEAIPEAVVILALPDLTPLYLNRAFRQTLGYDLSDLPDLERWMRRALPDAEDRQASQQQIQSLLTPPHPEFSLQTRARSAGGTDLDMEVWGAHLDPERLLLVLRDVTEQRRSEKKRQRLHEQQQRARKMEALGLLAGGVAHDLNNILTGLVTYPDLYLEDMAADDPLRAPLETILNTGMRARAVVEDLVAIARGVCALPQDLDLNQVLRDFLKSAGPTGPGGSLESERLDLGIHPEPLDIRGTPSQLCRSLTNLIRYATLAPGRVRVRTRRSRIKTVLPGFEDVEPGDYAVLTILAPGPEVAPEHLGRLFEPFFIREVLGRGQTGLELAVVWNIVRDHRGSIQVQSGPQGTRFDLYFPLRNPEGAGSTRRGDPAGEAQ